MIRRTAAGLAALLLGLGLAGPLGPPASARAAAGYCPDSSGVTVVVDFNELGGGTVVRCAQGAQSSGLTALRNAGFQVAGTARWGDSFVCRINGRPTVEAERCVDTPPATAYWSYWHASNGGRWTYSDKGLTGRRPPAGSFEGWSFSSRRGPDSAPTPGVAPVRPAPPPPPRPPTTTAPPPPAPGRPPSAPPAPGGVPAPTGPVVPVPPSGPPTPAATAVPGSPGVVPSGGPVPPAQTEGAGVTDPPVTEVAAERTGAGVPVGTLLGLGLLAALAVAGVLVARRRRSVGPGD